MIDPIKLGVSFSKDQSLAHAKLIAAAPDLLVVCKTIAAATRDTAGTSQEPAWLDDLLTAISKASL